MIETRESLANSMNIQLRSNAIPSDSESVKRIVTASQFFSAAEVSIAVELVEEWLLKGADAGYEFLIAETIPAEPTTVSQAFAGYICYGEIPCTIGSYDIYWIEVAPEYQRSGIGRLLMQAAERDIQKRGGRRLYVDTSGKSQYASTREFYIRCGFTIACEMPDFYDVGDSKVVLSLIHI